MSSAARVTHRMDGDVPTVTVEGEIDIANVAELRDTILQSLPHRAAGVVLDLSSTTYLDSQGVHLLLDLTERLHTRRLRFAVVAPTGSFVRRVIELSHVQTVVRTESSLAEALAHVRKE